VNEETGMGNKPDYPDYMAEPVLEQNLQMFASAAPDKKEITNCRETTVLRTNERAGTPSLYSRGEDRCIRIEMGKFPFLLGKMAGGVDYCLARDSVSRIHCRFTKDEAGNVFLTDLGSTNGTFRNGQRLLMQAPARIVPGDEIRIADMVFDYR
jgi:hypothetical protein